MHFHLPHSSLFLTASLLGPPLTHSPTLLIRPLTRPHRFDPSLLEMDIDLSQLAEGLDPVQKQATMDRLNQYHKAGCGKGAWGEEERFYSPFGGNGAYWTQNSVSHARQRIFRQLFLLGAVRVREKKQGNKREGTDLRSWAARP